MIIIVQMFCTEGLLKFGGVGILFKNIVIIVCNSKIVFGILITIIKSCIKASSVSIPLVRPNVQRVPGWTDHVKEECNRSLFWFIGYGWRQVNRSKVLFIKLLN